MKHTLGIFALVLGIASGLFARPAGAVDWSVSLGSPNQSGAPGSTVTYSGTISNTSGSSILIDAGIDFTTSPETENFTISFSSGLIALGLLIPPGGYAGALFDVTWAPTVSSGTSGSGTFQLNTNDAVVPNVVSASFQLKTPGIGTFCTQGTGLIAVSSSVVSDDSTTITPRIAWHNPGSGTLGYSMLASNSWITSTIATGVGGQARPSLVLDSSRKPHVAYYDAALGNLVHASNLTGSWTTETVDAIGDVGAAASLAVDNFGNLHVSYQDVTNGDLKYAHQYAGTWTVEVVDTAGVLGANSSLAVDDAGVPFISYYDGTNQDLKYATKSGSTWTRSTLDAAGPVGSWSSIAVRNGVVSIAYRDATPGLARLRYTSGSGVTWTYETADATGDPGIGSQLELNSLGEPRIAYFDQSTQNVMYALKSQGSWSTGVVAAGATGAIGLARTVTDEPFLSYTLASGSALRFASFTNCSVTDVDEPIAIGTRLQLYPNRPNPFTHGTIISFTVRERSTTRVRIFDAAGRLVAEPFNKVVLPGTYKVAWNGADDSRRALAPGLYLYEVRSASEVRRGRMVLLQ